MYIYVCVPLFCMSGIRMRPGINRPPLSGTSSVSHYLRRGSNMPCLFQRLFQHFKSLTDKYKKQNFAIHKYYVWSLVFFSTGLLYINHVQFFMSLVFSPWCVCRVCRVFSSLIYIKTSLYGHVKEILIESFEICVLGD